MPGRDGADLAAELRKQLPGLPIGLLTGYSHSPLIPAALKSGVAVFKKPVIVQELVAFLETEIGRDEAAPGRVFFRRPNELPGERIAQSEQVLAPSALQPLRGFRAIVDVAVERLGWCQARRRAASGSTSEPRSTARAPAESRPCSWWIASSR